MKYEKDIKKRSDSLEDRWVLPPGFTVAAGTTINEYMLGTVSNRSRGVSAVRQGTSLHESISAERVAARTEWDRERDATRWTATVGSARSWISDLAETVGIAMDVASVVEPEED